LSEDTIIVKNSVSINEDVLKEIKDRISEIIKRTDYYDIRKGHKFYIVDEFFKTNFKKRSHGPLRCSKYFAISDLTGGKPRINAKELAVILNEKEWD
jgi:hypothetical protein